MADNKEDEKWAIEDDCDQEAIVTGNDSRKKVTKSPDQDQPIIRCIGELSVDFRYVQHDYKPTGPGTATVFHVTGNNTKAFAITAAHCFRDAALECTQCKIYMTKKIINNNNKIVNRTTCKQCYSGNYLKTKILDATAIHFTRNEIKNKTTMTDADGENVEYYYGDPKKTYECKLEYIPHNYINAPHPKSGYDYAVISFEIKDNYNYKQYVQNISVQVVGSTLRNKQIEGFRIFGYPHYKNKKIGMVGHKSTGKKYEIKVYAKTQQLYLEQKEVDTTIGQSGSVLWFTSNNCTVIFGIHTGGSGTNKYNVATIIDNRVFSNIMAATVQNGMNFVPCLKQLESNRASRVLMVIGQTGIGKTETLNNMMNYLWGVKFEDKHRYTLVSEGDVDHLFPVTKDVTAYHLAPPNVDFQLTVIDTPGFDQIGYVNELEDIMVTRKIKTFFDTIQGIDAVCLVFKSCDNRLGARQKYVLAQMLNLFGKDIKENVFVLFTFGDGAEPPLLHWLKKSVIQCKTWFQFNNASGRIEITEEKNNTNRFARWFWELSMKSFDELFRSIAQCEANPLMLTKRVLELRNQIQGYVEQSHPPIESIRSCISDLEKIALRPTPLLETDYIDELINYYKSEKPSGWETHVAKLSKLKKQQQILSYAITQ